MKKAILSLIVIFFTGVYFPVISFGEGDLQGSLNGAIQALIPNAGTPKQDLNYVDIAKEVQFWVFVFIGVIAVAYIIYIGAKLLWAPGNTEQITIALKSLAYVVL